jgi:hypothetical protein
VFLIFFCKRLGLMSLGLRFRVKGLDLLYGTSMTMLGFRVNNLDS